MTDTPPTPAALVRCCALWISAGAGMTGAVDIDSDYSWSHCDTRPFRSRTATAYAGCMAVVPTAPIDRAYGSRPSYRQGLWLRCPTCEIVGHLVQFSREAGRGLADSGTRWPRWPNGAPDLLVTPVTRWPDSGAGWPLCSARCGLAHLDSSLRWNDGLRPPELCNTAPAGPPLGMLPAPHSVCPPA